MSSILAFSASEENAEKTVRSGLDRLIISIDGTTGEVMLGEVPTVDSEVTQVIKGRLAPDKSSIYKIDQINISCPNLVSLNYSFYKLFFS